MKNLIAKLIFAGLFLFFALVNFSIQERAVNPDISLFMKNIQALADGESGEIYCSWGCEFRVWDVCISCNHCGMYLMDWNEVGSVGVCI